jgi:hypothetical protein
MRTTTYRVLLHTYSEWSLRKLSNTTVWWTWDRFQMCKILPINLRGSRPDWRWSLLTLVIVWRGVASYGITVKCGQAHLVRVVLYHHACGAASSGYQCLLCMRWKSRETASAACYLKYWTIVTLFVANNKQHGRSREASHKRYQSD